MSTGLRQVGDALNSAFQEMGYADESLRATAGKGKTTLDLGMYRLRDQAVSMGMNADGADYVERRARAQYDKAVSFTESPIERAMIAALLTGRWLGFETIPPIVHNATKGSIELLPLGDVIIVPQLAFVRYRLDFGIVVEKDGRRQVVAVECDGAAFHADAVKDRFRDAYLDSWGVPTFRATGSSLDKDPIGAADEIIGSICRWRAS